MAPGQATDTLPNRQAWNTASTTHLLCNLEKLSNFSESHFPRREIMGKKALTIVRME
jgi:hypothetical protein